MFLFSLLLFSLAATGSSLITLPISRRVNLTETETLRTRDLSRVNYLLARVSGPGISERDTTNIPIASQGLHSHYTASIGIGSPPTNYNVIVDTGSGNTWIGASQPYVKTSTSIDTLVDVAVPYFYYRGYDELFGEEFLDQVTIVPGLVIANQSIGVAGTVQGDDFTGVDGVLGLGPVDLTQDTLSTDNSQVPTVTDNAFSQGLIPANQIAISFEPVGQDGIFHGEITWGGVDPSKFIGDINFAPPAPGFNPYWSLQQSITYGTSGELIMPISSGMVDTGTTLLWLDPTSFAAYQRATGAVFAGDTQNGLLQITPAQFENLESLFFTINGVTYEFPPSAQVWPQALNSAIGGKSNVMYLIVALGVSPQGFINGQVFLERFYSVWDTNTHRVGFANAPESTVSCIFC
ncbi:acid protease, partial [Mycena latifolia]